VLIVGDERWPFPIRLVRLNNTWRFDAQLARSEILYRRIGRNEMSAIDACGVYVAAQKEYAEKGFAGKGVYARRFISRPGKKDGLYWPAPSGEDPVRSVNSPPLLRSRDIPSKASGGLPIRAITIRSSPDKGRTPRAAKSTIW